MIRRLILPSLLAICLTSSSLYAKDLFLKEDRKDLVESMKKEMDNDVNLKICDELFKEADEILRFNQILRTLVKKYAYIAIKEYFDTSDSSKNKKQVRELFLASKEFAKKADDALDKALGKYEDFHRRKEKDKATILDFKQREERSKKIDAALKDYKNFNKKSDEFLERTVVKVSVVAPFNPKNFKIINPKIDKYLTLFADFKYLIKHNLEEYNYLITIARGYHDRALSSYLEAL